MTGSNDEKLIDELANLLNETAEAHHKAFAATEGEDPDWPIWYADYLLEKMRQMLKARFTKSELIYLLVSAEKRMELLLLVLTGLDSTQNTLLADIYRSKYLVKDYVTQFYHNILVIRDHYRFGMRTTTRLSAPSIQYWSSISF
jgi:hypothetical protein